MNEEQGKCAQASGSHVKEWDFVYEPGIANFIAALNEMSNAGWELFSFKNENGHNLGIVWRWKQ